MSTQPHTVDDRLAERLEWFQDLKFGFFVHWGPYSQWGCIESWPLVEVDKWARPDGLKCWEERARDMKRFQRDYWALNETFSPTRFDPNTWVEAVKRTGMKYFVFTTKHHDGFCMFDTRHTDYRITHPLCPFSANPKANIARELFKAFRAEGFGIGVYFSKADWHSPYYWNPDAPALTRNPNYDTLKDAARWDKFVHFVHSQIEDLMTGYGPVDILWLDAGQVRPPKQDIQMDRLAGMARRRQPGLLVVDRTVGGKHENYRTPEQEVPDSPPAYVWESCITMGDQWSYKPDDNYKSTRKLIHLLVDIVSKGGNLLLNVGPQPDGQLPPPAVSRLEEIGNWMDVNAEAIHATRPCPPYKHGRVAFTRRGKNLYAIYLAEQGQDAPPDTIALPPLDLASDSPVLVLGLRDRLKWRRHSEGIAISVPASVRHSIPCHHAFVFKLSLP